MRRNLLLFFLSALSCQFSFSQVTNTESFEGGSFTPVGSGGLGFTLNSLFGGTFVTGNTPAGYTPSSVPYASNGSTAYSVGILGATFTSANLSTVGASFVSLQFRVQAATLSTFFDWGVDPSDFVRVSISPDGGSTWWNTAELRGGNNVNWSYAASGTSSALYDANNTPTVITASGTNQTLLSGPSTIRINGLPLGISNLRVRFEVATNGLFELWVLDQIQLVRGSSAPLPVNFANLQARAETAYTTISWSNLTESDVDYYAVERSVDGRNFEVIGKLQPKANNYSKQDYSFVDASPLTSGFYRVKAVEFNATTKTSIVLHVSGQNRGRKGGFHVYPNPVQGGILSLQAADAEGGNYTVQLFNTNGQRVYNRTLQLQGGVISQSLELPSHMKPGMYLLKIQGTTTQTTSTVIVQ